LIRVVGREKVVAIMALFEYKKVPGCRAAKGVLRAKVMGIRSFRALTKFTPLWPL